MGKSGVLQLMRAHEVLAPRRRACSGSGLMLVRNGKGRKDRIVPVCGAAAAVLNVYLVEGRPALSVAAIHQCGGEGWIRSERLSLRIYSNVWLGVKWKRRRR